MVVNPDESLNSNMWIIPLLPDRLPGRVRKKLDGGQLFIEPLINGLPLIDGKIVQEFFAFKGDAKLGDYVTFLWKNPGHREFDDATKHPSAINIKVASEDEAANIVNNIQKTLAEELHSQLKQQQDELKQELEAVAQKAEELAQQRTQDLCDGLNRKAHELTQQENSLVEKRQLLDEQQAHIESLAAIAKKAEYFWGRLEPYRTAIPLVREDETDDAAEPCPLPENLGSQWDEMLCSSGLPLPSYIGTSYLLALVSALYSGSLILLNGSVGVGKTSLIRHSADLLGGKSQVIPVRPAWLDSSDLLGFFDPLSETFRPSPFLTALKDAKKHSDRLHLVCLDELNLAKIENYGADLLSSLEYSRSQQGGLLLYSESIETELWEEARQLNEEEKRDSKQLQRFKRIQNLLKDYPANFIIPRNLVLLGTLNADETTYDLSPKVIDRSFVITYPPANLTLEIVLELLNSKSIYKTISVSNLLYEMKERLGRTMEGWKIVVKWNTQYLSKLGIPLGHRAKRDYAIFSAAANLLGFTENECLGHFLVTKLLPRISFFKDSASSQDNREDLCHSWFKELDAYRDFGVSETITKMQDQLDDERRRNISYWG